MSEKSQPFVVTDRRKFNSEGDPRPDADPDPEREPRAVSTMPPAEATASGTSGASAPLQFGDSHPAGAASVGDAPAREAGAETDQELPPPPTVEQMEQSRLAFEATADRLDTAIRSANLGMDHPPAMSFDQIVQSVYMQAILQMGGGTQQGQQPQVDILGAKQSVDMLGILNEKTANNLSDAEQTLLTSALFELRLAFLEITQALARSAQQRAGQAPGTGGPTAMPGRPGPSIVR
jgi:hypothetical protein